MVGALETDLRAVTTQWMAPFMEERDLYGGLLEMLEQRRRDDGESASSTALIYYLNFADSYELINRFRAMVPTAVGDAVRMFTSQLEPIVPRRNRVMHLRPLQDGDLDSVRKVCIDFVNTGLDLPELRGALNNLAKYPSWRPELDRGEQLVLNNIPLAEFDETGLIGRRDAADELLALLLRRNDRVITLVGEGMIGKTALTVQVLDELIHHAECPYGTVLWTSLKRERLTGDGVEEIVGAARGVLSELDEWLALVGEDPQAGLTALCRILDGMQALIVIDNLETVTADEFMEFYDQLPSDVHILLTSRVGLGQIERRVPIGPLTEKDATLLLRGWAKARRLDQLQRLSQDQLAIQATRLRLSPGAIRWYAEATAAGHAPGDLLANQDDLLRFCLESIYEGLGERPRVVLSVLDVADRDLALGDIALHTRLPVDDIRRALMELSRRSLVATTLVGDAGTHETFVVSDSTRHFLRSAARSDQALVEQVERREREIREERSDQALKAAKNPLAPSVVGGGDVEAHAGVDHLLRHAIRRNIKFEEALAELEEAESLDPEYYEIQRVRAWLLSNNRSTVQATQSYRAAFELAPNSEAKARVAYFFADHMAKYERDEEEAARLAGIAHDHFGLPVTAARLGMVLMYQESWDDAEPLIRVGTSDEDVRAALIARTMLVGLAKRKLEFENKINRLPVAGIAAAGPTLTETQSYLATGRVDGKLEDALVELAYEMLFVASSCGDLGLVENELAQAAEVLRKRAARVLTGRQGEYISRVLYKLFEPGTAVPEKVRSAAGACLREINELGGGERRVGRIKFFNRTKGFGFIIADDGEEFHLRVQAVPQPQAQIFLVPGAPVEFTIAEDNNEVLAPGENRLASSVMLTEEHASGLRKRRAKITYADDRRCVAEDRDTAVSVVVARGAFERSEVFNAAEVGDLIAGDYVSTSTGIEVAPGSCRILAS